MGIFYILVQIASGLLGWASARNKAIDLAALPVAGVFCYFIIMPAGPGSAIARARKIFEMPDGTLWITWVTIALYVCGRICSEVAINMSEYTPREEDLGWAAFTGSKQNYRAQEQHYNQSEPEFSQSQSSFHSKWANSGSKSNSNPPKHSEEDEHLRTLGLRRGASFKDIKRAYRKLAMRCHPDKAVAAGKSDAEIRKTEAHMQQINDAYAWLEARA